MARNNKKSSSSRKGNRPKGSVARSATSERHRPPDDSIPSPVPSQQRNDNVSTDDIVVPSILEYSETPHHDEILHGDGSNVPAPSADSKRNKAQTPTQPYDDDPVPSMATNLSDSIHGLDVNPQDFIGEVGASGTGNSPNVTLQAPKDPIDPYVSVYWPNRLTKHLE